ncbi:MAG TPA: KH domain-containing protein [Solirubrobacteraceae bacterium]
MARQGRPALDHRPQAPQDPGHLVLKDLLVYLAQLLVDHPDGVKVEQVEEDDGTIVLELSVDEDDYGQVIGRGGRTANALRTVVKASAVRENRRVLVDIVD